MAKEMLINTAEGEECRIALLEDGRLEELYMERANFTSHVGNIYKGKVTNVEASIQAAFIDFGLGRNGFLHITDLMPSYFGRGGGDMTESVGRKLSRRDRPPIQRCLRRGDDIIVQIIKEGIGTKGPTLSTYLSIPGRILVMMPGMAKFGVSRRIEDDDERRRLRQILDSLKPIDDVGFIIRTAGIGKSKLEIQRDLAYLTRVWQNIDRLGREPAPVELYTEGDLVTRTVRDVYTPDVERIVVDNKDVAMRVKAFFKIAMPRSKTRLQLYEGPVPLFHRAGIERDIEQMYGRHVPLPSGGSLVIDSTEAVVAIDVNSGKFREHADAETTAFKTDMEAADEIPRQLRLRDLGGVIICDFIDLRFERHRRELEKRLHDNLKNDRAKSRVLRMSQFGIIEMTRQRMRPSLKRSIYTDCPSCKGAGLVKTPESMSLDVARRLAIAAHDERVVRIELSVNPDVANYLLNRKRVQLAKLEEQTGKPINVRADASLGLDGIRLELFDAREGAVWIEELGMKPAEADTDDQHGRGSRGGRRGRGGRGGRGRADGRELGDRDHHRLRLPPLSPARPEEPDEQEQDEGAQEAAAAVDERSDAIAYRGERGVEDDRTDADAIDAETGELEGGKPDGAEAREPDSDDLSEAVGDDRPARLRGPVEYGEDAGHRDAGHRDAAEGDLADDGAHANDGELEMTGSDDESSVVEVDEGAEPIGEAPRAFDEDRGGGRGYRGGRDGGGRNRGGGDRVAGDRAGGDRDGPRGGQRRRGRRGGGRGGGQGGGHGGGQGGDRPALHSQGASHRPPPVRANPFHDDAGPAAPAHREVDEESDNRGNRRAGAEAPAARSGPQGPNAGQSGARDAARGDESGEGDGRRRRRRRGGRRHRRRRERAEANRLAAERGEPLPYDLSSDTESDKESDNLPEPAAGAGPEDDAQNGPPSAVELEESSSIAEVVEESTSESAVESPAEETEPRPKRGGRSRGGASRSRQPEPRSRRTAPKRMPPTEAKPASSAGSSAGSASTAGRRSPVGADKHLADDVPIDPEPPRRPRSVSDLDDIHGELD
jgi:ribonuclease E